MEAYGCRCGRAGASAAVAASFLCFHTDLAACFVLLPVLLFALVEIADSLFPASTDAFVYHSPARVALFQRPPPSALV